jgi:hypothetical protein
MCSQTPRRAAAALLIAIAVTLSCAAPSQALAGQPRRDSEEAARVEPGRGFIAFLLHLFAFAGGAMDPNGAH